MLTTKYTRITMLRFAVKDTDFDSLSGDLTGPTAIAVSKTDATAPARIIAKYAKDVESLEMKSGVVEGTFYDKDGIKVYRKYSIKRRTACKIPWKYPVSNYKLCSCY